MFLSHLRKKSTEYKNEIANLELKLNNNKIDFTSEVKILGVMIDSELGFEAQSKLVSSRVKSKTLLLRKSLYLFTDSFRPILFKIFIQPHFDYCSTLTLYFPKKNDLDRLINCFSKSIKHLLKLKKSFLSLSIEQQYDLLKPYNILPFQYRQFVRFCTFLFNVHQNKNTNLTQDFVPSATTTRSFYKLSSLGHSNFKKYCFSTISIKLFNKFIGRFLSDNEKHISVVLFKKYLHEHITELYNSSIDYWS
jgi:hypothetical protein